MDAQTFYPVTRRFVIEALSGARSAVTRTFIRALEAEASSIIRSEEWALANH